jgi:hypothetical protein
VCVCPEQQAAPAPNHAYPSTIHPGTRVCACVFVCERSFIYGIQIPSQPNHPPSQPNHPPNHPPWQAPNMFDRPASLHKCCLIWSTHVKLSTSWSSKQSVCCCLCPYTDFIQHVTMLFYECDSAATYLPLRYWVLRQLFSTCLMEACKP